MYDATGKWIYFSGSETGSYCIYRMKADGTLRQQLTFSKAGEEDARAYISNDGTVMIYNKIEKNRIDIRWCKIKNK